jgi:transcriptional regulator GlxA family with amidase domain
LLPSPETAMMIAMTASVKTRRVVLVAFDRLQALDLVGPAEVFSMASRLTAGAYSIEVVAALTSEISTSSGLHLRPDRSLAACRGAIDTLIVVGGEGVPDALAEGSIVPWTARAASRSRRVASVCNGAFLLARAGLLDGRRATTHWSACETLQRRHPEVDVGPDAIFVRDGDVYTSAGVTAGMDLSLALVEEDLGRRTALEVARWLVLFLKRPGGQSQFSVQLSAQVAEREPLRDLQAWISDNLDTDLSVPALAERACMSPRNFARAFRREVGVTPAAYVEAARVEAARVALDGTQEPIESIARRCGFGTVETMRRAFHRRLGVGPSSYRERFLTLEAA